MLKPGEFIAQRYELKEQVGRGGFATVYRATDQLFNRDVAIKIAEFGDTPANEVSELLAEARFIASQRHPNVLDVYDFGQEGTSAYLVLPFATGGSFSGYLKSKQRLSVQETAHFLQQIASGLDHAHSLDLVHRDIKPANILLFEPKPYHVAISDFGLAKFIEQSSSNYSSTQVSGTPSYMSPEQIQGKPTKATDIYALGVMLYQMLTGELPYRGEPTVVMYAHINAPVPLAHQTNPDISPRLSEIVARAMAKQPEARPHQAAEIYEEFRRALDNSANELTTPIASFASGVGSQSQSGTNSGSTQIAVPTEQSGTISLDSGGNSKAVAANGLEEKPETPKKKTRFQFKLNFSINIAISIGAIAICLIAGILALNAQNAKDSALTGGGVAIQATTQPATDNPAAGAPAPGVPAPGTTNAASTTAAARPTDDTSAGDTPPTILGGMPEPAVPAPTVAASGGGGTTVAAGSVQFTPTPRPSVASDTGSGAPAPTPVRGTLPPSAPRPTQPVAPAQGSTPAPTYAVIVPPVPTTNSATVGWLLEEAWNSYKAEFMQTDGRVIDPAGGISTSEGQSYALLRAVWLKDRATFDLALKWAMDNLNTGRNDKLFSYKWGKTADGKWQVLDKNNATDSDIDIALSLIFAAKEWNEPAYSKQAQEIIKDIWEKTVVTIKDKPYLTAGEWAVGQSRPTINVSYLAPYAFRIFATLDPAHNWNGLVDSSYEAIRACSENELGGVKSARLPANWCAIDKTSGQYTAPEEASKLDTNYGYDAFRTYWRVALDYRWFGEKRALDYLKSSNVLAEKYRAEGRLAAIYSYSGAIVEKDEALSTYAGLVANLLFTDPAAAKNIVDNKFINGFYKGVKPGGTTNIAAWRNFDNYYTQNWAWFGLALYANLLPNLSK